MGQVAADPSERLPWLADAPPAPPARPRTRPQPRQPRRSWVPLLLAVSAAGAIAFGGWSVIQGDTVPASRPATVEPVETVALPPPTIAPEAAAEPQAPLASERDALRPAPAEQPVTTARPNRRVSKAAPRRRAATRIEAVPATNAPPYDPRAWQSGVRGRIIQLGAFRTSAQAHGEWKRVYYRHPLLRPLPPRVVKSKIRGRTYYRLQLGTFSQAHSELLCQRLRATGEGCIVLGLRGR